MEIKSLQDRVNESKYELATTKMKEARTENDYKNVIELFEEIADYEDSQDKIAECKSAICEIICDKAKEFEKSGIILGYEKAISVYKTAKDYGDVDSKIAACQDRIKEIKDAEAAVIKAKQMKIAKIAILAVAGLAVVIGAIYFFAVGLPNMKVEKKYNKAMSLIASGDYIGASDILDEIASYKDSRAQYMEIRDNKIQQAISQTEIGGTYTMGGINWYVIGKEDNKALLISADVLEIRAFHSMYTKAPWMNSNIRSYLNGTFMSAFNDVERSVILASTVTNAAGKFGQGGTGDTIDSIFLLSLDEVETYMTSAGLRAATYSGASTSWWLRSAGCNEYRVAYVGEDGTVYDSGVKVNEEIIGVRPAMWVSLG